MNIIIYNKATITAWQGEIDKLQEQIASLTQGSLSATEKEQKKHPLQEKTTSLHKDVVTGNQFLDNLEKRPQDLVKQLSDKILNSLTEYEQSHPKSPIQIRVCLYKLDKKLDFIKQVTESHLPQTAIRIQYLKLCALVQDMHEEVSTKKTDPAFIKLLEDILESTHIDMGGDLPDNMRTGQTATTYRRELKQDRDLFPNARQLLDYEKKLAKTTDKTIEDELSEDNPTSHTATDGSSEPIEEQVAAVEDAVKLATSHEGTCDGTKQIEEQVAAVEDGAKLQASQTATGGDSSKHLEEPLTTSEVSPTASGNNDEQTGTAESLEEQYAKLLKKLQIRIIVQNTLQAKIDLAVNAVEAEVQAKKRRKEAIDYLFYTQLLTELWKLSNSATTADTAPFISVFTQLTADVTDTYSLGKRVVGAILAIVGLLLIAASIATLVATFSGSSLVSSVGIALGVSLLSSEIVLSTTAGMTAAVGAGLTFWGVTKFKEGQGRELSKAVSEVRDELIQPTPTLESTSPSL